jgi:glycosyltransferase involved in cell wall biosynthesis
VFEPNARGHAQEWLLHLVRYLEDARLGVTVSMALAPRLVSAIEQSGPGERPSGIRLLRLSPREVRACTHRLLVVSSFARWWVLRRYVRTTRADRIVALEVDHLTLPLALRLSMGGSAGVVGVLFRPSVHYPDRGGSGSGWKDRLRDWRKDLLYALTLRNPATRAVLSLDPYFPEFASRRYRFGSKVGAVPDPVCYPDDPGVADLPLAQRLPPDRTAFVLFGALARRKGIMVLLEALARIEPAYAERVAVIAAGEVEPGLQAALRSGIRELRIRRPEIWFDLEDRHLPASELATLVARSDVVLAPYQRFVGSSGVLLWAANTGKPVLTSSYGLIGRFVKEYRLGLALDTADPSVLAGGVIEMVREGPAKFVDQQGAAAFVRGRTPADFANAILRTALGQADSLDGKPAHSPYEESTTD